MMVGDMSDDDITGAGPPAAPAPGPPAWGARPPGWTGSPGWTGPATPRRLPVRPSPVFLGLVAAFAGSGVLCAARVGNPRIWVFAFVALGWVISLCLHEFAHAAVAWKAGDHSVEAKGYLTLDPRRYMNSQTSIVLPILIVLIGGIALPGGAVMVDRRFVRDRRMQSLISASGPLTNLVCALLCAVPLATRMVRYDLSLDAPPGTHDAFAAALALLALLEIIATILNSLPVPGFDGFGVIAPYLPDHTVRSLLPISRFAWFAMFVVLFYSAAANSAFFGLCDHVLVAMGVDSYLGRYGQWLFTFWHRT
jgi:Zn-dependent protease